MRTLLVSSTVLLLFAGSASMAHATGGLFPYGSLSFNYQQSPSGPYGGKFFASGHLTNPTSFPPSGTGACFGAVFEFAGRHILLIVGGVRNDDGSVDVAYLAVRSDDPLAPGPYSIAPYGGQARFGFLDGGSGTVLPEDPWTTDWDSWFDDPADGHAFRGVSGTVTLTAVGEDGIEATFSGTATEGCPGLTIDVSKGHFVLGSPTLPVEGRSWSSIKGDYRD